ncbi:MAG: heme exporter protein CcmD [Amphiplicatus sp.]|jgi:heme exporter protein D
MSDFLGMGGYAGFVWPAYAVSALGIGGLCFFLWRRGKSVRERLEAAEDRAARKDNAA